MSSSTDKVVRVATVPCDGICFSKYEVNEETGEEIWSGPPGIGIIMTRELAKQLNFTIQYVRSTGWGTPANLEDPNDPINTAIVAQLQLDVADFSPCSITRTEARNAVIKFSATPHKMDEIIMAALNHDGGGHFKEMSADSVLEPFDLNTWTIIVGLFILYGVTLSSVKCQNSSEHRRCSRFMWFCHWFSIALIDLLCALLCKPTSTPDTPLRGVVCVIFLLWYVPAFLLGILYGGEVVAYLSQPSAGTFISSWDECLAKLAAGELRAVSRSSTWLRSQSEHLFGPAAARKIVWLPDLEECFNELMMPTGGSDPTLVWIDAAAELQGQLMFSGIHPPHEVYIMGEGHALGSGFLGFGYNPRRTDLIATFDPWIRRYADTGHITHWIEVSEREVVAYYSDKIKAQKAKRSSGAASDPSLDTTDYDALYPADFLGAFICYALISALALCSLVSESIYRSSSASSSKSSMFKRSKRKRSYLWDQFDSPQNSLKRRVKQVSVQLTFHMMDTIESG